MKYIIDYRAKRRRPYHVLEYSKGVYRKVAEYKDPYKATQLVHRLEQDDRENADRAVLAGILKNN